MNNKIRVLFFLGLGAMGLATIVGQEFPRGGMTPRPTNAYIVGGVRHGASFFPRADYPQVKPRKPGEIDFAHYHTYDEVLSILKAWEKEFPNLVELTSAGKSFEGRDIWQMTLTNKTTGKDTDKPAMYIAGNRHSGEVTAAESALWFVWHILTAYGKDPELTRLVDTKTLYVRVKNNPDGSELYLQTAQSNRSTVRPNDAQYMRDTWMKESLRDMGQPSSHGSYVHLYVNGLYFGLYNLSERLGQDFLSTHLGGQPEDWEVNEDFGTPGARWQAMMAIDPSTLTGYGQMQQYLDMEDFADYILLHLSADAEDWPHHNGYAAANARSGDGKFRFFVWDQEIVLDYHGRAASRIDNASGAGAVFQKLRTSEEFRLLFADRVYKHCFNDGALSLAASQERYRSVANWIDKAIVAESARWGDVKMTTPYGSTFQQPNPLTDINHIMYPPVPHAPNYYFTREDSWVVERDNVINNYLPAVHNMANSYALIRVLRAEGLYPDLDPPEFRVNGVSQHGGQISVGAVLTLTNPNGRGTIYYTLDGSGISAEPGTTRGSPAGGAGVSSGPIRHIGPIILSENTHLKARILDKGQWSALNEATYSASAEN